MDDKENDDKKTQLDTPVNAKSWAGHIFHRDA